MTARLHPGFAAFLLLLLPAPGLADVVRVAVDHAYVVALAQKLAARDYAAPPAVPAFFRDLDYDRYRSITFNPAMTLWHEDDLGFQVQFFHPGYLFKHLVRLNEFSDTHVQAVPFKHNLFNYQDLDVPLLSRWGLDFAGFRVLNRINQPDKWDEVIAFLGASYYRALGRLQVYGASARGLALNAGGPATEEFPLFREFWLGKPGAGAKSVTIHALLDGPSVAGAYTFVFTPGPETVVETQATLFFRKKADLPGFAPVSSMFWYGEGSANHFGDFRPEVHDSDGLLVAPDKDSRLWRPLENPPDLVRSDFDVPAFAGFGLLQRDRSFGSYADMESNFERRPGIWTEPIGTWPPGYVRLVELPAKNEYQDNVTAFWAPRDPIPVGQRLDLAWRQHWSLAPVFGGPPGWVAATRQTVHDGAPDRTMFVIDYNPSSLASVPAGAEIKAEVNVNPAAKIVHCQVLRHEPDGGRRVILQLQAPPGSPSVEIHVQLVLDKKPLTEIWTTRWQP